MTILDKMDSNGNRERMDVKATLTKLGYVEFVNVLDYENKVFYNYIPKVDKCSIHELHLDINVKEIFEKLKDPKSGFMKFHGMHSPKWIKDKKFWTFVITVPPKPHEEVEEVEDPENINLKLVLFFDTETKELKWLVEKRHNIVMEVLEGFSKKEFKDEDFVIKDCKTPEFGSEFDDWFLE